MVIELVHQWATKKKKRESSFMDLERMSNNTKTLYQYPNPNKHIERESNVPLA